MAISLKNLKKVRSTSAPRTLIYGPPGLGKTTLASEWPNPVFLQFEEGTPANKELDSFGQLTSYQELTEALTALYCEDHGFQTVVIDSLSALEPIIWDATCAYPEHKWNNIESPGYGKGYVAAANFWREIITGRFVDVAGYPGHPGLNHLRNDKGMAIVLIAHSKVGRFDDPRTSSYSKFEVCMQDKAAAVITREMDLVVFVNSEATIKSESLGFNKNRTHAEGGLTRWMYVDNVPSMNAKNRYDMPPKFPYVKGKGFETLAPYFPQPSAPAPAVAPQPETVTDKVAA